jgi:excisionase family DNA binding protein
MTTNLIQMYSPREVAGQLSVCTKTVLSLVRSGRLQPVYRINSRVIRIPRSAVESYLEGYVSADILPLPEPRGEVG